MNYENRLWRQLGPGPYMSHNEKFERPFTSKNGGIRAKSARPTTSIDTDYRPIRIKIYKNGDRFDAGTELFVTRREFKHWLMFLDIITKKINSPQVVQTLYDLDGDEVTEFKELEDGGQYVAAGFERLKGKVQYGKYRSRTWQPPSRMPNHVDPTGVDSHESIEIYLKKMGFESQSGKMYPFDDPDRDPQTKAAVQQASLEKALKRQRLKEERAATRLTQYHSLPGIQQTNSVARRIENLRQQPEDQRNYPDHNMQTPEKYRNGYGSRYPYQNFDRYPQPAEWRNDKYYANYSYSRRGSYDDEYSDQGYSSDRHHDRRYSPLPPISRGRLYRNNSIGSSAYQYSQPRTSRAKSAHDVFERLARQRGSTARRRKN